MNTTLTLLPFNILEAAIQPAHQFAHHFFDCNSYYKYTVLTRFEFLIFKQYQNQRKRMHKDF